MPVVSRKLSQPIPIIADIPTSAPQLGFAEYADALCDAIRGGMPPQFTIGIYGAWGSGKTSLLRAIEANLGRDAAAVPVFFDAWRFERSEFIVVPLLHAVYAALKQSKAGTAAEAVRRALGSLIDSMSFRIGVLGIDISLKDMRGRMRRGANLDPLDAAFAKPFADLQAISSTLGQNRVVVLIDDLDRCSSNNVVTLLEAINLVLDIPGFIFVLALDYDVLTKAVEARFPHVPGHVFIEKMVQVPFRVPRLDLEGEDALSELIDEWEACREQLPPSFPEHAKDISKLALDSNPRQIKRLINSVLVLNRIVEQSIRSDDRTFALLMGLMGLQLRWPDQYRRFAENVFAEEERETVRMPVDLDDAQLQRYANRLLSEDYSVETLRRLLQLTETVGASDLGTQAEPRESSIAQSRLNFERDRRVFERNRKIVVSKMRDSGFDLARRSLISYYSPQYPDLRFKITGQRLNLERDYRGKHFGGGWRVVAWYSLVRSLEAALAAVEDPEHPPAQAGTQVARK